MVTYASKNSMGVVNKATGVITGAGAIAEVDLGFTPRHVKVVNITDVIVWEKIDGMAASTCVKTVAAGTTTADTTTAITIDEGGFSLSAALAASAKSLIWVAEG